MSEIKKAIAILIKWEIKDFNLFRSGEKGGRPNWEIENRKNNKRYAFTAFGSDDIDGLHEIV